MAARDPLPSGVALHLQRFAMIYRFDAFAGPGGVYVYTLVPDCLFAEGFDP